jgi:hypothetical protein
MNFTSHTAARMRTAIAGLALAAICALGIAPASAASTIPVGTKFNVNLATPDINSKNAQPGDQFTMAVVAPYPNNNPKYNGAQIYGHVASASAASQGRKAVLTLAFDKIVFPDGERGEVAGTMIAAKTVSENTTARKALGAGAGMAVGSQTIGRILGGSAGGVVGMLGGAAAGYAYANNAKANFSIVKGAPAVVQTTAATHVRAQARY